MEKETTREREYGLPSTWLTCSLVSINCLSFVYSSLVVSPLLADRAWIGYREFCLRKKVLCSFFTMLVELNSLRLTDIHMLRRKVDN